MVTSTFLQPVTPPRKAGKIETMAQLVFKGPVTRPDKDHRKTGPQPHWTENRMD
jgi:hypothetical protein